MSSSVPLCHTQLWVLTELHHLYQNCCCMQTPGTINQGSQAVVSAPGRDFSSETLQKHEIHVRNWVKVHLRLHCFKEYFWRHIIVFCNPCIACLVQRKKIILGYLMLWAVYRQENFQTNICFTWSKASQ